MSDLMMIVHTSVTEKTTHTMLLTPWCGACQITLSDLMMNVHTYVTDNTTYHMVYVRLMLFLISYYNITCQYHLQLTSFVMLYVRSVCLI